MKFWRIWLDTIFIIGLILFVLIALFITSFGHKN